MNVLWMNIPPHTFWGWTGEISLGLFVVWIIVITALIMREPSSSSRAVVRREQQAASRAHQAIDELYRDAREEVRWRARGE